MQYRIEHDSMGEVQVPADKYWGAQTQRSYENFKIGNEKIPAEVITAFSYLKEAAAIANFRLGKMDEKKTNLISQVCEEIREGKLEGIREGKLEGKRNQLEQDVRGMYAEGIMPDVISRITKTSIDTVKEILGLQSA